jgi:hypothetical protein
VLVVGAGRDDNGRSVPLARDRIRSGVDPYPNRSAAQTVDGSPSAATPDGGAAPAVLAPGVRRLFLCRAHAPMIEKFRVTFRVMATVCACIAFRACVTHIRRAVLYPLSYEGMWIPDRLPDWWNEGAQGRRASPVNAS